MEALQEKDKEISQWRLLVEEAERRMNKMRSRGKDSKKHKKLLREKNQEIKLLK